MSEDVDIHRLSEEARPALDDLLQSDENQLYETLEMRRLAIDDRPSVAGDFSLAVTYDADLLGPLDDLREFGRRYFARVSKQIYGLVCGSDAENASARNDLLSALTDRHTFAALLASLLVAHLGFAPALAAVLAALAVRLFFATAKDTMCDMWRASLPAAS